MNKVTKRDLLDNGYVVMADDKYSYIKKMGEDYNIIMLLTRNESWNPLYKMMDGSDQLSLHCKREDRVLFSHRRNELSLDKVEHSINNAFQEDKISRNEDNNS